MLQKISRGIKIFLFKIDLFSSSQLLRYRKQTNYSTLTGGALSLVIIIIFGTLLLQSSIQVFTFSNVTAQDSIYFSEDPTYTTFNFDDSSPFILGIGIAGLNLNQGPRYFDITLSTQFYSYGTFMNETYHHLQPCKYDQWAHVNQIGANSYTNANLSNFLCPSSNVTAELEGKYTSENFKFLKMKISKCKNSTDPSRPCLDEFTINQAGTYNVNYYFMNAYVNSNDLFPVKYYIEDRNYFGFTLSSTVVANVYMTQQIISTDNSLYPWQSITNQTVLLVNQLAEVKTSQAVKDVYISVYLRKSPYYKLSNRSFQKLLDLFSSIGGLFGFAVAFFIFIQNYNQAAYQIEMGDNLFYYSSSQPLKSKSFNFFYYLILCIYQFLKIFGILIPWQKMKKYDECRQEVVQQLDLSLLMNKTTFLQKCMNILFEEHQFRAIYLQQKPDVKQAEILRRNHGLNKIIHNQPRRINNKIRKQVKREKTKMIKAIMDIPKTDSVIFEKDNKQYQKVQSDNKIPYDLIDVVANFVMKDIKNPSQESIRSASESSEKNGKESQFEDIELQKVAQQNFDSYRFINTALNDIKLLEEQTKKGNLISKKIYSQINNDITKEQFIVLKCLETIMARKSQSEQSQQLRATQKQSIFDTILKFVKQKEDAEENNAGGLQIVLESNDRIKTNHEL